MTDYLDMLLEQRFSAELQAAAADERRRLQREIAERQKAQQERDAFRTYLQECSRVLNEMSFGFPEITDEMKDAQIKLTSAILSLRESFQ